MGGIMRLKNKKTGEIRELPDGFFCGDSLKKICEEWEDAPEEPKEYWYIEPNGVIARICFTEADKKIMKQIGNYFETKEEAEKAVEKLKAWKRLKDKGFRFEGWDNTDCSTIHNFSLFVAIEDLEGVNKDLDLLFGGEE
jgi:hypothetical protein